MPTSVDWSPPGGEVITLDPFSNYSEQNLALWPVDAPRAIHSVSERIADSLAVPVLVLDTDLRVVFTNQPFSAVFGVSAEEAIGCALDEVGRGQWDSADMRAALGHCVGGNGRGDQREIRCVPVSSGPRTMRLTTRMLAGDDSTGHVLILMEDVTGRQAVERLRHDFIGLIGHEMSNALTLVAGEAQCMQRHGEYDARALTSIVTQALVLGRLVQDLLDTPSFDPDTFGIDRRRIDLVDLAQTATHQAQITSPCHSLRLESPSGRLEGFWDRDRLSQVFSNLLSNAIKYSPAGGEILVSLEDLGTAARVSIRDQGVGIETEALRHLFDQSYRVPDSGRHVRGLGLGLYITRLLVKAHGGDMTVESMPDQGSTFHFILPRALPRLESAQHPGRSA